MRDLIIATLAITLLIGGWLIFIHYASDQTQAFRKEIEEEILPGIEAENWESVQKHMDTLNHDWHKFRRLSLFFLDTHTITEIDYSLAKSIRYARACDVSNSSGELASIVEQFSFLIEDESLSPKNIF